MFEKLQGMAKQMQMLQRLLKDENMRTLMSHPKVQTLFTDPEFQTVLKTQDPAKIMSFARLQTLMQDPEVAVLISKVDPKMFLQASS